MAAYTTIDDPSAYFKVQLYTGNGTAIGSGGKVVTFDDTDTDMQPDMVWSKNRSITSSHNVWDDLRGSSGSYNRWYPDTSDAEDTGVSEGLSTFNSDGMTFGNSGQGNGSGNSHVAWCWKETADAGFDMVLYTGTGSAHTISHSLSAKPGFFILKARSRVANGQVWHNGLSADSKILYLSTNHSEQTHGDIHNSTQPTSSVFTVGSASESNDDDETYIAYLWAAKQGFSKFGSYTGNGNADGTFIYLGFKPAWFMIKRTTTDGYNWAIKDNKRSPYNEATTEMYADTNDADENSGGAIDFLSNGVKIRNSSGTWNASGVVYVFMAFAEAPLVNSEGEPCNAR